MSNGSTSAQYAITMRLEYPHESGWIARVSSAIGRARGVITAIDLVQIRSGISIRDYSIECASTEHAERIVKAVQRLKGVTVQSVSDKTFLIHLGGKIEITPKVTVKTRADLSMAYTPGVARVCMAVHEDYESSFNLTVRHNCIAVVSDGSAVLGLGNIGPAAAMPVMEGKAVLFKEFAGVDAFPLCVATQDADEIVRLCEQIAPSFGGINLEDISSPRCFYIEEQLKERLDIPVLHDDQHGTAVVTLAGVINALRITGKKAPEIKVVVAGAGAAGIACSRALLRYGVENIIICDSKGAISRRRKFANNPVKAWAAAETNPRNETGSLKKVVQGADLFLGLSGPKLLTRADVARMAKDPIIFAMANPVPEVLPEEVADIVAVMATGRSDYPNQINNVLAFPGIFRGALDCRASDINQDMLQAAAEAMAAIVTDEVLSPDYIIPSVFDRKVAKAVAAAVVRAAEETGVARRIPKKTGITLA